MCGQLTPIIHDFHRLLTKLKKLSNNQAKILDFDDDVTEFDLEIKPNDGYYKRGKFDFKIKTTNYPQEAPKVSCATRIYHPNISDEDNGDVCLSLFDDWTASNDLEDCVQGLLFLLYNPNLDDPLNPYFDPEDEEQHRSFEEDVKRSLEGAEIEGIYYERNIMEDEENENSETPEKERNTSCEEKEVEESHNVDSQAILSNDDTTPSEDKNKELSEYDILSNRNDTNICHDKTGLQNARHQLETDETKTR